MVVSIKKELKFNYFTKSPIYLLLKLESIFLVHRQQTLANFGGAVMVVLVWWLNLQLSVQSVPITTKNVSSNTTQCEVC
jgi:hypothetical protein